MIAQTWLVFIEYGNVRHASCSKKLSHVRRAWASAAWIETIKLVHSFRDLSTQEENWDECRRSLERKIQTLQAEIKEHEETIDRMAKASSKGNKDDDIRTQAAQKKLDKVNAEVDSLKAVLELKTDEVRQLRNENVRLAEKLEEFDLTTLALRKASQQVEDLKAQIDAKTCAERKLSAENRQLCTTVEREASEKKRLSMENEELQWRIRQSTDGIMSLSTIDGECWLLA